MTLHAQCIFQLHTASWVMYRYSVTVNMMQESVCMVSTVRVIVTRLCTPTEVGKDEVVRFAATGT